MTTSRESALDASSESADDEILADLLERMLAESRGGQAPDLNALCAAHPALAPQIRELWGTLRLAEDFASLSGGPLDEVPTLLPTEFALSNPGGLQLPCRVGDYELLEAIGRGGMGIVFKARQLSLGRIVALKMILRGNLAGPEDVARFQTEAEAAARLDHPAVVPVYEVGQHSGEPFFSMKYVEGTTLAKRLAEGPLDAREAARILLPIARAIAEAHRRGLLHRDLKPSNILIDADGQPFVTDFGLAKRIVPDSDDLRNEQSARYAEEVTRSGAILGTPGYMAPEQAAGARGDVGPAADVYGLGALLYAMLTGRAPFQAASPFDTILMVLEQEPVPPRLVNRSADPDLEMIALKCLQKPSDLRYASAEDLADDLAAYLANEPISARSSRFSQVISRALRETHHAGVLENWGLLWMWHSLVLLVLCLATNAMALAGVQSRMMYAGVWVVGLSVWASIFWNLRRRAGPITFVERQIAHVWAGSVITSTLLYAVEALMGLPVLSLSPVLGLISGMVFLVKAGILSGAFYVQAALLFATGLVMAAIAASPLPDFGVALFGLVSAGCFFVPGWHYHQRRIGRTRGGRG